MNTGKKLGVALVQMNVVETKTDNITNAVKWIRQAVQNHKAKLVILPEMFNTMHGKRQLFEQNAENVQTGETWKILSNLTKELNIYLIAGTIPEKDNNNYYNTCVVYGPDGTIKWKYQQLHLVKANVQNQCTLNEMDYMKTGKNITILDIDGWKIGLGVCVDLRYPELAALYKKNGVHLMVYMINHPVLLGQHNAEQLTRVRALDNQFYVVNVAPAKNPMVNVNEYVSHGHSMIVDPHGNVMDRLDDNEKILYRELDLTDWDKYRQQYGLIDNKRYDLYDIVYKK